MDRNGAQVFAWPGDIRRRDHKRWGDVQILINNGGVAQAVNFTDMRNDVRDDTLETNLTGAYNCCKIFLPARLQAKWGRIINIASITAKTGYVM